MNFYVGEHSQEGSLQTNKQQSHIKTSCASDCSISKWHTCVHASTLWCSNMHVVHKKGVSGTNTDVRITIDPQDLNKAVLRKYHPMTAFYDAITRTDICTNGEGITGDCVRCAQVPYICLWKNGRDCWDGSSNTGTYFWETSSSSASPAAKDDTSAATTLQFYAGSDERKRHSCGGRSQQSIPACRVPQWLNPWAIFFCTWHSRQSHYEQWTSVWVVWIQQIHIWMELPVGQQ